MASRDDFQVNLLTGHPERWADEVTISILGRTTVAGVLTRISSDAREVVSDVDYAILCLPGYLIASTQEMVPFLKKRCDRE